LRTRTRQANRLKQCVLHNQRAAQKPSAPLRSALTKLRLSETGDVATIALDERDASRVVHEKASGEISGAHVVRRARRAHSEHHACSVERLKRLGRGVSGVESGGVGGLGISGVGVGGAAGSSSGGGGSSKSDIGSIGEPTNAIGVNVAILRLNEQPTSGIGGGAGARCGGLRVADGGASRPSNRVEIGLFIVRIRLGNIR
jgi:hypothetical protein